jgi:hypothetical protein
MMGSDGLVSTMLAQHKEEIDLVDGMLATDFFSHGMPLTPFGERARDKHRENHKVSRTAYVALGVEGNASTIRSVQLPILRVSSVTLPSGQTARPSARLLLTPFWVADRNLSLRSISPHDKQRCH